MSTDTCVAERHGTRYAYQKYGCRCPDAVKDNRVYAREYHRRHRHHLNALKLLRETQERIKELAS